MEGHRVPQLHLYLPKELAAEVKRRARARRLSVSRYLASVVKRDVAEDWPEAFFQEVVGGWLGEPLERAPQGGAAPRDALL